MRVAPPSAPEAVEWFACFGGTCGVCVTGRGAAGTPREAAARARRRLLEWHEQFTRFDPGSELSRLNADPRPQVPVTPMMARFIGAALAAARLTDGMVDPTLLGAVTRAGYAQDFAALAAPAEPTGPPDPLPPPRPAAPDPRARWREITLDRARTAVSRPPGLGLDSGGIAKGLFADMLAPILATHGSFAVIAAGDVRIGGSAGTPRAVTVSDPFDPGRVLHSFALTSGAVATSGRTKRSWRDAQGRLAHHIIDPSTGAPAFTGLAQVTALAPTGVEAEALAKAALLAGADAAPGWLAYGGVIVTDDGEPTIVAEHGSAVAA